MKLRSFLTGLAVFVVGLLSIGIVVFGVLVSRNPIDALQAQGKPSPEALIFVPQQAPALVSILVNPDRLEAAEQALVSVGERRRSHQALEQLKQTVLDATHLDYDRDVRPWLGNEVTLAVTRLDLDQNEDNGWQPGYLLALETRDTERSQQFLDRFWQYQAIGGSDLSFESYAGINLVYASSPTPVRSERTKIASVPSPSTPTFATAAVGDQFVLIANHPQVLRDAINTVQAPELRLNRSDIYQESSATFAASQVALTFVNFEQLAPWVTPQLNSPFYRGLLVGFTVDRAGLVGNATLLTAFGKALTPIQPSLTTPVEALQFIPAASPWVASGTHLPQTWHQLITPVQDYPPLATGVTDAIAALQTAWGIDLEADILPHLTGDYALGLIPRRDRLQPDWVFATTHSADLKETLTHLDAIALQQGNSVGSFTLGDQTVATWTKLLPAPDRRRRSSEDLLTLQADVLGVHTTVGDYDLFATSVEAMDQALNAPAQSILTSEGLQQAIAVLQTPNQGYLYLDWQPIEALITAQVPWASFATLPIQPIFDHVRSLTFSSQGNQETVQRGSVLIRLR